MTIRKGNYEEKDQDKSPLKQENSAEEPDGFDFAALHDHIAVNAVGPLRVCLALLPLMKDNGGKILNVSMLPRALTHNFTVVHAYSESFGKTAGTSGNTAIVDCHFLNQIFQTTFQKTFNKIVNINPFFFVFLKKIQTNLESIIKKMNFCEYAMNVNG